MIDDLKDKNLLEKKPTSVEIDVEPGLCLKQVQPDQSEEMFNLIVQNKEYLGKWLPFPGFTNAVSDSEAFIKSVIDDERNGKSYGYGIELDGKLVGHMSLMDLKEDDKDPEIGYWIAEVASSKGVTTKAVKALSDFGFDTLGLKKIIIRARPENVGSNRVAEKAGYVINGQSNNSDGDLCNVWEKIVK